MHATCFSLDAKQEIIHTEGVIWIHHLLFDWKQETRRESIPSAPLVLMEKQETRGVVKPIPTRASF